MSMDPTFSITELTESELLELRKTDAWLPSEATRRCLSSLKDTKGSSATTTVRLMAPPQPIDIEDKLERYLIAHYGSEKRADNIRPVITADMVSQDCEGLVQLLSGRWYHAALDMTGRLLTAAGHGPDAGTKLTPFTAQLWLTRFVLLKQTQQFDLMEAEMAAFGRLDNPDMYFGHAPHIYPGRKGSMIPFSMRLLHAELPYHLKRPVEALNGLYFLSAVVSRMISNLENGFTEDGLETCPNDTYKSTSLALWRRRECKIYSICLSIYLAGKDYPSAIDTVYQMIETLKPMNEHRFLYGTLGRIYLEFGDVVMAERMFKEALEGAPPDQTSTKIQRLLFNALLQIGNGKFDEAGRFYREVLQLDPTHVAASNNLAVCSHFTSQMEESVRILENLTTPALIQQQHHQAVGGDPSKVPIVALDDAVVSNLTVLLDAETDRSVERKLRVLERLAGLPGERVSLGAFKVPALKK